jgi:hypothetical protein
MADLSTTLARVVNDLQLLQGDMHDQASRTSSLIVAAHDYAREVSWPAEWGAQPTGPNAAQEAFRATLAACASVGEARKALLVVAGVIKEAAQRVSEAEAQGATRAAEIVRLRG